jgi:hypothetical protein
LYRYVLFRRWYLVAACHYAKNGPKMCIIARGPQTWRTLWARGPLSHRIMASINQVITSLKPMPEIRCLNIAANFDCRSPLSI